MSLAIQANYMGDYGKDGHWVAIKQEKTDDTEKSTKIRKFNTAEAAQSYVNLVNETGEDVFIYNENNNNNRTINPYSLEEPKCKDISFFRAFFSRLTDEQIREVNRTGKLPIGTKFIQNGAGGYTISNNILGFRVGTRVLPQGYELKKNILGFTLVVPIGTKGAVIKK